MVELRSEIRDRVALVTLDAPGRRNALSLGLVDEIVAAFDAIDADPDVGAVVVTGAPPAFCAGADLSHLGSSQRQGLSRIYEGFLRVGRSPLPTIAAVNGAAVGAGVNLALACDVILAGESARFDTRFIDLGLHPGGGHTWMLQRRIGSQAAAALVLFGRVLDGRQAERARLAWSCVPDDELLPLAMEMASAAARAPRPGGAHQADDARRHAADRRGGRSRARARPSGVVDQPAGVSGAAGGPPPADQHQQPLVGPPH